MEIHILVYADYITGVRAEYRSGIQAAIFQVHPSFSSSGKATIGCT